MTTATTRPPVVEATAAPAARNHGGLVEGIGDTVLVAGRNLRKITRIPGLIVFSTIQPVMFLLLFGYVFGGITKGAGLGISYRQYIVPAVLVQTLAFAGAATGVGLATDLQTGMIDRFRSLPMARAAVLLGRSLADTCRIGLQCVLLLLVAFAIGFRFLGGIAPGILMLLLAIAFGSSLSTFFAWVGLTLKDPETAQVAGFVPLFPLVFASSAFAPVRTLPGWLQAVAKVNPVTAATDSLRGLAVGSGPRHGAYTHNLGSSLWHLLLAMVVVAGLFTTLAVRKYKQV